MEFGKRLRFFRLQSIDPKTHKPLTQQKLGELLGLEMGDYGFSGAAISDWERGKSRIDASHRVVLLSLVKILNQHGGIKRPADAITLLESGNYRALNPQEAEKIFPGENIEGADPPPNSSNAHFPLGNLNFISPADYQAMLEESKKGPPPAWPRMAVSVVNKITSKISASRVLKAIVWIWIWLLAHFLLAPSLQWQALNTEGNVYSMVLYAAGTLALPPLIAALINTKDNAFWMEQKMRTSTALRLYVHQGAYVGFHVGYFLAFGVTSVQVLAGLSAIPWIEMIKTIIPIIISYTSAQIVPYNLWLAYRRLDIRDGGIFFIFALLGPLWALFFLEFHEVFSNPLTRAVVILLAVTILVTPQTIKYRIKGSQT
ncbi:MAG: XRE family transcriptional regulator [Anaerolineaceae bacterium]|jgi:transcriptional regulator with XRE-family HTH domain|nr:MAG: XRE family transcriptional regulator [Anaerolineaceae bacterium]